MPVGPRDTRAAASTGPPLGGASRPPRRHAHAGGGLGALIAQHACTRTFEARPFEEFEVGPARLLGLEAPPLLPPDGSCGSSSSSSDPYREKQGKIGRHVSEV